MKGWTVWVTTGSGKKNILVVCEDIDTAMRHGKSLGEVTSVMVIESDATAIIPTPTTRTP